MAIFAFSLWLFVCEGAPLTFELPRELEQQRALIFSPDDIRVLPRGGFIVGYNHYGVVLTNDFSVIWPPNFDGLKFPLAVQPDRRFVCKGNTNDNRCLIRLNWDQSLDTTFRSPVVSSNDLDRITGLQVLGDGRIIVGCFRPGGNPSPYAGINKGLFRLNFDGSDDPTFQTASSADVNFGVAALTDGKILAFGPPFRRYLPDGQLDSSFHSAMLEGIFFPWRFAIQTDGKIVVGGPTRADGLARPGLLRLNSDGTVDLSFNPSTGPRSVYSLKIQSDGRILVNNSGSIRRWFSNGGLDPSFIVNQGGGLIEDMDIDSSNRIYYTEDQYIYKLSGQFRVLLPPPDIPITLEKSDNLASGWFSVKAIPAATASEYIDESFPGSNNSFYRVRPSN